jgi:hypothetical protein
MASHCSVASTPALGELPISTVTYVTVGSAALRWVWAPLEASGLGILPADKG